MSKLDDAIREMQRVTSEAKEFADLRKRAKAFGVEVVKRGAGLAIQIASHGVVDDDIFRFGQDMANALNVAFSEEQPHG